jgi:hypothetical protein
MSKLAVVNVRKLWDDNLWDGQFYAKFDYSKWAEQIVCEWLSRKKQMVIESITQGKDTRYDVMMSGKKIEVKFQGSRFLSIEYAYADGTPSGIALTEADHYLMINQGSSSDGNGGWDKVGKVRLIPTHLIRAAILKKIAVGDIHVWQPGSTGPGSRCVHLDPKTDLPRDGWVGDVGYIETDTGPLFDFGPPPSEWSNQAIGRIAEALSLHQ